MKKRAEEKINIDLQSAMSTEKAGYIDLILFKVQK